MLNGAVICALAFYSLNAPTIEFFDRIGSCFGDNAVECIVLASGDTMPVAIFLGLALFLIADLVVLIWQGWASRHSA